MKFGENVTLRYGTIIYKNVTIGKNFKTGNNAVIREDCRIGDNCLVGTNSVLDGDVILGNNVSIQTGAYIVKGARIGNDVFIAPCVVMTNHKHPSVERAESLDAPFINDGAVIGAGAILLPKVRIGRNAVVGAGSVVTKDIPEEEVWVGNPARFYGKRSEVYK